MYTAIRIQLETLLYPQADDTGIQHVSDVGLIAAVASIAEWASVAAGARYNTVSEETPCLQISVTNPYPQPRDTTLRRIIHISGFVYDVWKSTV